MSAPVIVAVLAGLVSVASSFVVTLLAVGRYTQRVAYIEKAIEDLERGSVSKGERLEGLARELAKLEGTIQGRIEGEASAAHRAT